MIKTINSTPTILLVEETEELRTPFTSLLTTSGYQVEAAACEEDAVERVRRQRPDVILVNIGESEQRCAVPQAAFEIARRIRERAALRGGMPLLVISSGTPAENRKAVLGNNEYVLHPEPYKEVEHLLDRLLL